MANARFYRFWGDLTEALNTGQPQTAAKHTGRQLFEEHYSDPARLEQFMLAVSGIMGPPAHALPTRLTSRVMALFVMSGARRVKPA